MIEIQDRIFIEIKIDNTPMPEAANLVSSILLTEGNGVMFPSCRLILNDMQNILTDRLALTDGNQILITVGKKHSDVSTVTRQYRLFGMKQIPTTSGPQIKAVAVYDAPNFISANVRESFSGTSDQVLRQVASKCALAFEGPELVNGKVPNDSQIWLNVCKNRSAFTRDVIRHGYVDSHSAMTAAVTSLGILKYRDLISVINQPVDKIKFVFSHNIEESSDDSGRTVYTVHQAKDRSLAGVVNNWQNYGTTRAVHRLSGIDVSEDTVDVLTSGNALPINSQIKGTIGRSRVDYAPIDCGNVHPYYERALYQNVRLLSLFSERLSILVFSPTDVQLFDQVIYKQADAKLDEPVKNTDIYVVIGKSVYVKSGMSYAERIELARMSLTKDGESNLVTGNVQDPAAQKQSAIPEVQTNTSVQAAKSLMSVAAQASAICKTVSNLCTSCSSSLSMLPNSVLNLVPGIQNFTNILGMLTSNPAHSLNVLQSMIPAINQYGTYLNSSASLLEDSVAASHAAQQQLNQLDVGGSIASAGLFKQHMFSSGIGLTVPSAFGALEQAEQVSQVYRAVNYALSQAGTGLTSANGASPVLSALSTSMNSVFAATDRMNNSIGSGWNGTVGTVHNMQEPDAIPNIATNLIKLTSLVTSSLSYPSNGLRSVSTIPYIANQMLTVMKQLNSNGSPKWVDPNAPICRKDDLFLPTDDVANRQYKLKAASSAISSSANAYNKQLSGG